MTLLLTNEQVRAVSEKPGRPIQLTDPSTNEVFVLLRADDYARIRSLLEEDFSIRETYAAQFATAMNSGWSDPEMDDYNNYDEALRNLCTSTEVK